MYCPTNGKCLGQSARNVYQAEERNIRGDTIKLNIKAVKIVNAV